MATEPERPIEKLLTAAAKKRRDELGQPLELHPVDRRLLQGEVARKYAAANRSSQESAKGWLAWRLRLGWVLSAVTVLAVALAVILPIVPRHQPATVGDIAKLDRSPTAPTLDAPTAAPQNPQVVTAAAPSAPVAARGGAPAEVASADRARAASEGALVWADKKRAELPAEHVVADSANMKLKSEDVSSTTASPAASRANVNLADSSAADALRTRRGIANEAPAMSGRPAALAPAPSTVTAISTNSALLAVAAESNAKRETGPPTSAASGQFGATSKTPMLPDNTPSAAGAAAADSALRSFAAPAKAKSQVAVVQNFAQTPLSQKANVVSHSEKPTPVLSSFDMEQIGRELRITDKDGSVYSGFVELADSPISQNLPNNVREVGRAQNQDQANRFRQAITSNNAGTVNQAQSSPSAQNNSYQGMAQNYFFRVIGTNKSLKQQVVFSGNVLPDTNGLPLNQASNAPGLGGYQFAPGEPPTLQLLNSRISGKAVVGGGQEIQIEAVPTKK